MKPKVGSWDENIYGVEPVRGAKEGKSKLGDENGQVESKELLQYYKGAKGFVIKVHSGQEDSKKYNIIKNVNTIKDAINFANKFYEKHGGDFDYTGEISFLAPDGKVFDLIEEDLFVFAEGMKPEWFISQGEYCIIR